MTRLLIRSDRLGIGPMNVQRLSSTALRKRRRKLVRDLPPLAHVFEVRIISGGLGELGKTRCE
jgi:hypothetical protein